MTIGKNSTKTLASTERLPPQKEMRRKKEADYRGEHLEDYGEKKTSGATIFGKKLTNLNKTPIRGSEKSVSKVGTQENHKKI